MIKESFKEAISAWTVSGVMYILLYEGANDGIWPIVGHFHHSDMHLPQVADGVISSLVLPFAAGYLLASTSRLKVSPWALLITPTLFLLFAKYMADAFFPPMSSEITSDLLVGTIQGVCAAGGWLLDRKMRAERGQPSSV
jgi:hypothetical protein